MTERITLTRGQDKMHVTILEDGRVKVETDRISAAAHTSAENLLSSMEQLLGGQTIVEHKDGRGHTHEHEHIGSHHHH